MSTYGQDGYGWQSTGAAVYEEGEHANENGDLRESCPYPVGDEWRKVWMAGWDAFNKTREEWESLCDA